MNKRITSAMVKKIVVNYRKIAVLLMLDEAILTHTVLIMTKTVCSHKTASPLLHILHYLIKQDIVFYKVHFQRAMKIYS